MGTVRAKMLVRTSFFGARDPQSLRVAWGGPGIRRGRVRGSRLWTWGTSPT